MTLLWICRCHFQGAGETSLFPWIGDNCPARWLTDRPPLPPTSASNTITTDKQTASHGGHHLTSRLRKKKR
jgi:hypothetical protein